MEFYLHKLAYEVVFIIEFKQVQGVCEKMPND